ncbi:FAD-binding dehydrogenase [Oceanitalea stevensii]|uniref:FAD-binding dehydrogenase n=1 Tax=Oceanitalea stevensii TaxID=2763072 RepID=A0ABR8YZ33_9MICO|nr:FAD-binding dehydrogenase [Oceanitalea stevensii]MBD8060884.1 FAD-binding dehydrogenase [Oceanitalea stevensii]
MDADVIVVGAGLAGLVATAELAGAGRRVLLVDQEPLQNLGGQAYWSFGGLFLVDSPEQRRMGVHDDVELAWQDWQATAGFDRPREDRWPARWARAYVDFAAGEKRAWLHSLGVRFFPVVGWAERGGTLATGPGNSVPRFHIVWGTGPGLVAPFARQVRAAVDDGLVRLAPRHRVTRLTTSGGVVDGVAGQVLAPDTAARGEPTSREVVGDFALRAQAVVVASGGIGGNHELVRRWWPQSLGTPPERMLTGVPAYVDGSMLEVAEQAGANLVNRDRMWHYTEGIENYAPVWPGHGIRILPGPSSLWLDAAGRRLPAPLFPGFDTLATLRHLRATGHDHSWFVLTQRIIEKEFALSGSEQNPDLTGKDLRRLAERLRAGAPGPVAEFMRQGADFVVADSLEELVAGMNRVTPEAPLDLDVVAREVHARDREMANEFTKDAQVTALRQARTYRGDRLIRVAPPHRLLDPEAGPLVAVRLHVLTRKTLGGIETDLDGRVLTADGGPVPGLFAAGEAAGFGGGGVHGYRSLEGTFLGGCLFSGRQAGRGVIAQT